MMDYQQSQADNVSDRSDNEDESKKSVFDERTEEASASQYFQFYGYLAQQQNMMQDYVRTSTYQKAVLSNLSDFKDKIVLDVGAGSGILSFFAAQAGAKQVYAVEASSMAAHCETLVKANGYDKRITVIAGKVEDIKLPELVDTIISEPMGYMLLNERMLESFLHAKKFLKPGGKMYPSRGDLHIAPFCDEALYMEQCTKANFWCQESFHGVNLSSLRQQALKEYFRQPVVDTFHVGILLAPSIQWTLDFSKWHEEDLHRIEIPLEYVLTQTSYVHGLAFWFDVAFIGANQTVWLSTAPTEPLTHWYQVRCLLEKPILCRQGGVLSGHVHLIANKRQSYDVEIVLQCEGVAPTTDGGAAVVQVSKNTLDLKNPCFRYTGQPVQPPPGYNQQAGTGNGAAVGADAGGNILTSPTDAYWQSVLAAAAMQPNTLVENGNSTLMNGGGNGAPLPTTANARGVVPIDNLTATMGAAVVAAGGAGVPTISGIGGLLPSGQAVQLSPATVPTSFAQGSFGNAPASPIQPGAMQAACLPVVGHNQVAGDHYYLPASAHEDPTGLAAVSSRHFSSMNDALASQQHFTYQTTATASTSAGNHPVLKS